MSLRTSAPSAAAVPRWTVVVSTGALALGLLVGEADAASGNRSSASPLDRANIATTGPHGSELPETAGHRRKKKKRNFLSWILSLGPGAPIGPPSFTAYRELQQLRCDRVFDRVGELEQPARRLYKGAARACLAAFDGRDRLWERADAAYLAVAPRAAELTCMDQAALALLRRLVVLHARHPDRPFRLRPVEEHKAPPCPDVATLTPDHGLEGTVVELTGSHLVGPVTGVLVVDSDGSAWPVLLDEITVTADGALQFAMPEAPPPEASPVVCIALRAEPDWSADGALFTYDSPLPPAVAAPSCPPPEEE